MSRAIQRNDYIPFFNDLAVAKERVLVLDYDGTIAPFSVDRRQALPYSGIPDLLGRIMRDCRTRLILVSGRAAQEVPPLVGLTPMPEVWGAHGVERITADGRYEQIACSDEALELLARAENLLEQNGLEACLEIKLAAVAVHWRGQPPSKVLAIRTKAYRILETLAAHPDLVLAEFEEGIEIRLRAASKGSVLRMVLSELGDNVPVAYLGDDSTDEDAFRTLNGRGLTVLVRPTHRYTAAQIWLKPPDELMQFLDEWRRVCEMEQCA